MGDPVLQPPVTAAYPLEFVSNTNTIDHALLIGKDHIPPHGLGQHSELPTPAVQPLLQDVQRDAGQPAE